METLLLPYIIGIDWALNELAASPDNSLVRSSFTDDINQPKDKGCQRVFLKFP